MINLLPPKEKEELLQRRNIQLIIVLSNIIVFSLLSLALVLASLNFYILESVNYHKAFLDAFEKKYVNAESVPLKDIMKKYNTVFANTNNFYLERTYFKDVFDIVLSVSRPAGVTFDNLSLQRTAEKTIQVNISGVSTTRNNLLQFKDNLIDNVNIKNVYFPPESWIKPTNISFSATLEVIQP